MIKRIALVCTLLASSHLQAENLLDKMKKTPASQYSLSSVKLDIIAYKATESLPSRRYDREIETDKFEAHIEKFQSLSDSNNLILIASHTAKSKYVKKDTCKALLEHMKSTLPLSEIETYIFPESLLQEARTAKTLRYAILITAEENSDFKVTC